MQAIVIIKNIISKLWMSKAILCLIVLFFGCAIPKPSQFHTDQELMTQANKLYMSRDYSESLPFYENLLQRFATSPLRPDAELKIADAKFNMVEYIEAESAYSTFKSLHPTHPKAPYATYQIGLCHDKEAPKSVARDLMHTQRAIQVFSELKTRWPESAEAKLATPILEKNQRKLKLQDMYVVNFYFKKKKYAAAIGRLKDLAADPQFPDIQSEAQLKLAKAYVKTKDMENAKPLIEGLKMKPQYSKQAAQLLQ